MDYDFTYTGAEIQAILDTGKKLKDSGYIFLGVATPSTNPGTPTQKVYYEAKQAGTYTNFGGVVLPDGISLLIWNGSWTSETVVCGDGGVFDISVYKSTGGTLATFADLAAALDGGNNIPASARKGGMSVKFVQSSDNKYVQFRLMSDTFNTTPANWQGVDDEPTASDNLVISNGVYDKCESLSNPIYGINTHQGFINSSNTFNPDQGSGFCVKNYNYGKFKMQNTGGGSIYFYAFLKKNLYAEGLSFCDGHAQRYSLTDGELHEIDIPSDCEYIWFLTSTASTIFNISKSIILISGTNICKTFTEQIEEVVRGDIDVFKRELHNVDGESYSADLGFKKGHAYNILLKSLDCSSGTTNKIKLSIHLTYSGDSNTTYLLKLQENIDYSGNQYTIQFPEPAVKDYTIGISNIRAEGDVIIEIQDLSEVSLEGLQYNMGRCVKIDPHVLTDEEKTAARNNIGAASVEVEKELHYSGIDTEVVDLFCTSSNKYRGNTNDSSYVKAVQANDVIVIKAKGTLPAPFYELVTVYPVLNATAAYMTGITERGYLSGYNEISVPENGYIVLTKRNSNAAIENEFEIFSINGGENLVKTSINKRIDDVTKQSNELSQESPFAREFSDKDMFDSESYWRYHSLLLDDKYGTSEETAIQNLIDRFTSRGAEGHTLFRIAVISDTHGSGAYTYRKNSNLTFMSCVRPISVFNRIAGLCDAAMHGGDVSVSYGTSRRRQLAYMRSVLRQFRFADSIPFFITKGNHDDNNHSPYHYVEADMLNLDWDNNTYYSRSFSTFTAVTEDTWNGDDLYIRKNEFISDKEFRTFVQHWLCPSGANWSSNNGAYYYYDIASVKIRVIVANSFPRNDEYAPSDAEEYGWLAGTALDFSDKGNDKSNWSVIMLRHTNATTNEVAALKACINAFIGGNTWTYNGISYDFGTVNGGPMTFIAHIHGHEHHYCFSNGAGFFDIGETIGCCEEEKLGNASYYGISVWTFDLTDKKAYEDTIHGDTWCYNYNNNKLEIVVGQTFVAAESGLAGPVVASSSDDSIATCNSKNKVTAVATGDVTITVTGSDNNYYEYPIRVVASC